MKYLKLFESFSDIDWAKFSQELATQMRSSNLDYDFSTDDFYNDIEKYQDEKWYGDNWEEQFIKIGGRKSFKGFTSEARQLWLLKKIADKLGAPVKMCDMGCGIGLVVKYCQLMGMDAMGVEYQREEYEKIHKEFGIKVKYGNFFSMNLNFLKQMDIIYLYQPVHSKKTSFKLLDLISKNTKEEVVIVWSGMWNSIYQELLNSDEFSVCGIQRNYNDSVMAVITKIQENA